MNGTMNANAHATEVKKIDWITAETTLGYTKNDVTEATGKMIKPN